jgi:ribosomal protein S18 acetylase RimI-like enzyme
VSFAIQLASPADAAAIAALHVRAWEHTYRGILPDALIDSQTLVSRTRDWQHWLAQMMDSSWVLIAPGAEGLAGFISGGPERGAEPSCQGEIYALYLQAEAQGQGLGRALLTAGLHRLRAQGYANILIWVAAENQRARLFYQHLGGVLWTERLLEVRGFSVAEVGYVWHVQES